MLTALGRHLAVLLVGGTATAFVAYQRLNGNINHQAIDDLLDEDERPEKIVEEEGKEPLNILLMGSDKRTRRRPRTTSRASAPTPRSCCTSRPTARARSR